MSGNIEHLEPGESPLVQSTRLMQIREVDLEELERILPRLADDLMPLLAKSSPPNNRIRAQLRRVKSILSDIRWGYGPAEDFIKVEP